MPKRPRNEKPSLQTVSRRRVYEYAAVETLRDLVEHGVMTLSRVITNVLNLKGLFRRRIVNRPMRRGPGEDWLSDLWMRYNYSGGISSRLDYRRQNGPFISRNDLSPFLNGFSPETLNHLFG